MALSYNTTATTDGNGTWNYIDHNNNVIIRDGGLYDNGGTYILPEHHQEQEWKGRITFGDMGVELEKYNALEQITLNLIIEVFKCNIEQAKELIKDILKEKLEPKKENKEWIDPKLFEI